HRLADGARRARRLGFRRDLAVRETRARRNLAYDLVDARVEARHAGHVERHRSEIAGGPAQQRVDAVDRALNFARRRSLDRVHAVDQLGDRRAVARFGQAQAGDATFAPGNAATAERRVEERVLRLG